MKPCSTCNTQTKTFDLGIPPHAHDEKLEFVEHVLGVLVESRYGSDNPYTRLGERAVTTSHSQMFANVPLLTAAEIEAHLRLPLAPANGRWLLNRSGFSPKAAWAKARRLGRALDRWLKPTAIPFARASFPHVQPANLARGSPIIPGTFFFASSFAALANFA